MSCRGEIALTAAAVVALLASGARAQAPAGPETPSEPPAQTQGTAGDESPARGEDAAGREAARAAFEAGMAELRAGHYDGAVVHFRQSLAQAPRAATAFNLALALYRGQRYREALDVVVRLADGAYGALPERRAEEVARLRGSIEEELASLEVHLEGAERATVLIDGEPAGVLVAEEPFAAWLQPGAHHVVAELSEGPSLEDRVEVEAGDRLRMLLNVRTGTVVVESERRPAWPWVLLGVGAAAVVGGVVAAVVVSQRSDGPTVDPVYGRVQTLRFGR